MKNLRISAAVLNQTPFDWSGNHERIRRAIAQAREAEASILCLPELCITGYGCEDMFLSPGMLRRAGQQLVALIPETKGMVVSVGLPVLVRNAVYNAAALLVDGELIGLAAKQHLAGDGIHYEPRWFDAWEPGAVETIEFGEHTVPIGDLIFTVGDIRIGFEICEDAWAAARPGAGLAERGVDVLLNPSASHFAFGKHETRKRLVIEGSRAYGVAYVYTNLLGNESGRVIFDGGVLIAAAGKLVAEGPRLGFEEVVLTTAVIDLDLTRGKQARTASTRPRLGDLEERSVDCEFAWPDGIPPTPPHTPLAVPVKEVEFAQAVPLGLFDYMRKSWSNGFMLSLSGGADSSSVAMLVNLMVDLGCADLGEEVFRERLAYLKLPAGKRAIKERLLTCVYQSTRNSGEATLHSAKSLAEWIGAEWVHWSIDELVQDYETIVEKAIGRELTWEQDDIARQNIQARVRAPGVWMLANIKRAILVSTSNRSEAAVGYATMDGDTSGGLSPIAGVDKAFLLHWLRWIEREDPFGFGQAEGLSAVNALTPTAELRPPEDNQTDEDDLMPYPILERIEEIAIRDKQMPADVLATLQAEHPDIAHEQLKTWVVRFFKLWSRNQWKRERYAPCFHLDDENLDPKSWCRFPILSGGFRDELAEL